MDYGTLIIGGEREKRSGKMKIISKIFQKRRKCGGCNKTVKMLFSQDIRSLRKKYSRWLCAYCFLHMLIRGKRELKN